MIKENSLFRKAEQYLESLGYQHVDFSNYILRSGGINEGPICVSISQPKDWDEHGLFVRFISAPHMAEETNDILFTSEDWHIFTSMVTAITAVNNWNFMENVSTENWKREFIDLLKSHDRQLKDCVEVKGHGYVNTPSGDFEYYLSEMSAMEIMELANANPDLDITGYPVWVCSQTWGFLVADCIAFHMNPEQIAEYNRKYHDDFGANAYYKVPDKFNDDWLKPLKEFE